MGGYTLAVELKAMRAGRRNSVLGQQAKEFQQPHKAVVRAGFPVGPLEGVQMAGMGRYVYLIPEMFPLIIFTIELIITDNTSFLATLLMTVI